MAQAMRGRGWVPWLCAAAGFWCLLSMISGPALAQGSGEQSGPYKLRPGDVIIVNVLEDAELDRQVLMLPDGRISLPVAGTIKADGRTPDQLAAIIRSRLSRNFVQPPNVTVTVSALAPYEEEIDETETATVFVLGEVARPGRYEYEAEAPITVIKALSLAGGVGPFAARSRIQIRELEGETETLRLFDYADFEDGLIATSRDLADLRDGAVIVVPERGLFE